MTGIVIPLSCALQIQDLGGFRRLMVPGSFYFPGAFAPFSRQSENVLKPFEFLFVFLSFLAVDAQGGHRSGLESFIRDILTTLFADAKGPLIKSG